MHVTKHKTTLLTSCTAHGIQDGLSAAIYVLLPILAQTFGLNYGQVGLFKGAKSLAQSLLEVSSGVACERFGERYVLVFGLIISGVGYMMLSFASTPNIMLLCFIILGAGGAYHHAPSSALVSRVYSVESRRRALGFYNSSGDAGKLIFTALFSLALMVAVSWQTVSLSYGVISVAVAIVVYWMFKQSGIGGLADYTEKNRISRKLGWGILHRPRFSALLTTVLLDSMVQSGVLTFVAFVMIAKGIPVYVATFAAVLVLIGGMFGKAVCGFLADRIGMRPAFAVLQGLTALGLILLIYASSTTAYILLPFLGVALQGTTSITYVIVNDLIHPERVARGYSMIYTASSVASIIGPLGFGHIGDQYGIETAVLGMATIAIIAILPCWFLKLNIPISSRAA